MFVELSRTPNPGLKGGGVRFALKAGKVFAAGAGDGNRAPPILWLLASYHLLPGTVKAERVELWLGFL